MKKYLFTLIKTFVITLEELSITGSYWIVTRRLDRLFYAPQKQKLNEEKS